MAEKKKKEEVIHWADRIAKKIIKEKGDKERYTLAAGITPSGVVHIGNFREVITIELIARALKSLGKEVRFIYSWDDYDVFRKVPVNMPKRDELKRYLRQPIVDVPDTTGEYSNYAERNEKKMEKDMPLLGIFPEYIYQSKKYRNCDYAEEIKMAMDKKGMIREHLNKFRKEPLDKDWYPVSVFCEKCNTDATKVKEHNGYNVTYTCKCGHEDTFDIREKGIIKLLWRVDWPMRWYYEKVDFESGGKDHFAAGGSFDTCKDIVKFVYNYEPPSAARYEWIKIKGGQQFSSSAGVATTVSDVMEIYEPEIIRWLFAGSRPATEFSIAFDEEVIKLYEDFDHVERVYYGEDKVTDKEKKKQSRIYELSVVDKPRHRIPYQPSFRHLTNVVQMYDMNIDKAVAYYEKDLEDDFDKERLRLRAMCAKNWIEKYAPDNYKFKIQKNIPVDLVIDKKIKKIFSKLAVRLKEKTWSDKDLHGEFYVLCESEGVKHKDFFKAAYKILINKEQGPKLASFILMLGERAIELFREASR